MFYMRASILLSALTVFLLVSASSVSARLSYHGIESTINDDLSVSTKVTLKFSSQENHLDYYTSFPISKLKVGGNFGPVSCKDSVLDDGTMISCELAGISTEKNTLYLEFESMDMVNYSYGRYHFTADYASSLDADKFFHLIKLPESATLAEFPVNTSYSPSYGNIITDGMRIMVLWDSSGIKADQRLDFRVEYNLPPIRGSVTRYILIGSGIIIMMVITTALLYTRKASRYNKSKVIASVLNPDEKRVVDILAVGGGGALQKHIVRESGFSKAKVSRLVKSLGGRGIIRVEPVSGRENRILLRTEKGDAEEKKGLAQKTSE